MSAVTPSYTLDKGKLSAPTITLKNCPTICLSRKLNSARMAPSGSILAGSLTVALRRGLVMYFRGIDASLFCGLFEHAHCTHFLQVSHERRLFYTAYMT